MELQHYLIKTEGLINEYYKQGLTNQWALKLTERISINYSSYFDKKNYPLEIIKDYPLEIRINKNNELFRLNTFCGEIVDIRAANKMTALFTQGLSYGCCSIEDGTKEENILDLKKTVLEHILYISDYCYINNYRLQASICKSIIKNSSGIQVQTLDVYERIRIVCNNGIVIPISINKKVSLDKIGVFLKSISTLKKNDDSCNNELEILLIMPFYYFKEIIELLKGNNQYIISGDLEDSPYELLRLFMEFKSMEDIALGGGMIGEDYSYEKYIILNNIANIENIDFNTGEFLFICRNSMQFKAGRPVGTVDIYLKGCIFEILSQATYCKLDIFLESNNHIAFKHVVNYL